MMNLIPDFLANMLPAADPMTFEQLRQQRLREAQLAQAMRAFQGVQALGAPRAQPQQDMGPATLPRRVTQVQLPGILG